VLAQDLLAQAQGMLLGLAEVARSMVFGLAPEVQQSDIFLKQL
jgi:hypothetical protein